VNEVTSKAKREDLEKVNGSYINPALVGLAYDQVCFATLHFIIGIKNSLLEHITVRLRHHETACLSELPLLTEGRDKLLHNIAKVKQRRDSYNKDHKSEKQQWKEYCWRLQSAQISQDALYFFPCQSLFKEIWHCCFVFLRFS
jgi:hypothetical protein